MGVNLSTRQFQDAALVERVARVLRETELAPETLVLELTESVLIHDVAATTATLERLRALGVRVALDDFGTGYSSLAYLRRFPIDILKIDKTFVDDVTSASADGAELTRAVIALGQTLGLRTVAEGIERSEQAFALRKHGCDLGQGFLFAKPLDPGALTALLEEQRTRGARRTRSTRPRSGTERGTAVSASRRRAETSSSG